MNPKLSWKITTYILLLLWALFTLLPLYWLLSATFKPPGEAIGYPPTFIPRHPTLKNFGYLLFKSRFGFKSYINSIINRCKDKKLAAKKLNISLATLYRKSEQGTHTYEN